MLQKADSLRESNVLGINSNIKIVLRAGPPLFHPNPNPNPRPLPPQRLL